MKITLNTYDKEDATIASHVGKIFISHHCENIVYLCTSINKNGNLDAYILENKFENKGSKYLTGTFVKNFSHINDEPWYGTVTLDNTKN
jgi:hypothetical protein